MTRAAEMKSDGKQKLTLGISKQVIENAKAAGINISEITEQLLKALTLSPEGNTKADVISAYSNFFDAIRDLLGKYGAFISVGSGTYWVVYSPDEKETPVHWSLILRKDGLSKAEEEVDEYKETEVTVEEVIDKLSDPREILERLITSITYAAEKNKEKLAQLDFARRLVKTLVEGEEG